MYDLPPAPPSVDVNDWIAAIAEVRAYCQWHIAPEVTETITVDGTGAPLVVLPTLNLVDVVSITDDGTAVTDPEWSRSGMVYRGTWASWTHKLRGVVAEVTHGYEEWPSELLRVAETIANGMTSLASVKQVTSGSHQFTLDASLSIPQRETLARYQLPFLQ